MKDVMEQKRQFLEHLKMERGRSDKTIENYNRYLERFFAFSKIKTVSQISETQIQAFRLHLATQPGSKTGSSVEPMKLQTQNYYFIALRSFLTFLKTKSIEVISPDCITLAKVPERSIDTISPTELAQLLAAPQTKTLEGKRDRAILELLFSTGLRISELCALSIADIDTERNEFQVRGKGDSTRVVFLSETAKKYLEEYLAARTDGEEALFVRYGRKANDGGDARLSVRAVQRLVKSYALKAGISQTVTPKVIRHSFATDLLSSGADLRFVQALMGHTTIGTTQVYARMSDTNLQKVHNKYHNKQ